MSEKEKVDVREMIQRKRAEKLAQAQTAVIERTENAATETIVGSYVYVPKNPLDREPLRFWYQKSCIEIKPYSVIHEATIVRELQKMGHMVKPLDDSFRSHACIGCGLVQMIPLG